jgi:hypothetical protein
MTPDEFAEASEQMERMITYCADATRTYVETRCEGEHTVNRACFAIGITLMGTLVETQPDEAMRMLDNILKKNGMAWRVVQVH